MNFNYKENGGKKTFLAKPCGEHDYNAHNKNNGDYYEYPSLS